MNFRLAAYLAWRSLRHHVGVALATVLGVAIGMTVVGAILIVDHNSIETRVEGEFTPTLTASSALATGATADGLDPHGADQATRIMRVSFERAGQASAPPQNDTGFPTQEGQIKTDLIPDAPPMRRGEEDYQAMRLAVRLASLMAFFVSAVIVFYTMRFSVAARSREFSLLLCLGEHRRNVTLSLMVEAGLLGVAGSLTGLLAAFPIATLLIGIGISTTGRVPSSDFAIPWLELGTMASLSMLIAVVGVAGPMRSLFQMRIVEVLQPRFMSPEQDARHQHLRGLGWLVPPLMAATYLAVRPFLSSWLSVVEFFLIETVFTGMLALAILWWMRPLLHACIRLAEAVLKPAFPLESLLVGRRMRLTSRKLVFTIAGVTLVFSLLTALHDITSALKHEIDGWARQALYPYVFFVRASVAERDDAAVRKAAERQGLHVFRLSRKVSGEFPLRLVAAADVNPFLRAQGRPGLYPGVAMVSHTIAARFGLVQGDRVVIHTDKQTHRFELIEVTDAIGFFAENGQYVDLKSYFLFSDGNPLFADNLERSLGDYAVARKRTTGRLQAEDIHALQPHYQAIKSGQGLGTWQKEEINRDFLIFDFILLMTIILAAVGVSNSMLIEVHARERELSVLRTVGVSRAQTTRLLLVEGAIIGLVSAMLALILGHTVGAISVAFLDRFTLFEYEFVASIKAGVLISILAIATCCVAAIYPALVANRISSAESLHYE